MPDLPQGPDRQGWMVQVGWGPVGWAAPRALSQPLLRTEMRHVALREMATTQAFSEGAAELGWCGCWAWGPWPSFWAPKLLWVSSMGATGFPRAGVSLLATLGHPEAGSQVGCWLAGPPLSQGHSSLTRAVSCSKGTTSFPLWERLLGFKWSTAMVLGYLKEAENCALGPWKVGWGQGVGREKHPRACGLREGQARQEVSSVGFTAMECRRAEGGWLSCTGHRRLGLRPQEGEHRTRQDLLRELMSQRSGMSQG